MEEQPSQLQSPVDRLWWFAQMEQGIEEADLDREPRFGSKQVLHRLTKVYRRDPSRDLEDVILHWHEVKVGAFK